VVSRAEHAGHVVYILSAAAVLVWSRALGLMTPLSSKLGAMLYILRRAAEEVGVLVPVVLTLMLVSNVGTAGHDLCTPVCDCGASVVLTCWCWWCSRSCW
jgi:hypothetical protein